jgi:hypothetical protein
MKLDEFLRRLVRVASDQKASDEAAARVGESREALFAELARLTNAAQQRVPGLSLSDVESALESLKKVLPPTGLDPTVPTFIETHWKSRLITWVARFSGAFIVLTIVSVAVVVAARNGFGLHLVPETPKAYVAILAGIYATVPPAYFFWEYFGAYRKIGMPGSLDLYRQGQQVAIALWAGFTAALAALAISDWVKPEPRTYHCEIAESTVSSSHVQVECKK